MKILLDECLPLDLRHSFPEHETHTAQWAGFKGKKNGELLTLAEAGGYGALLTVDQGLPHHRLAGRRLAIVLIHSRTNQLEDLLPLVERSRELWTRSNPVRPWSCLDSTITIRLCPPGTD